MEIKKVDAAQGWRWIKESARIFTVEPKVGLLFFLLSLIRWKVLIGIPMFGYLILIFVTPLIVGILFLTYRNHLSDTTLELKRFFEAVRSFAPALLRVGFVYAAGLILSAAVLQILTGNFTAAMAILGDTRAFDRIMSQGGVTNILFASALIPLTVSFLLFFAAWFAPAIIVFNGYKAKEAMESSLRATYRNAPAFLLFGIILGGLWLAYLIAIYLIPGIILIPFSLSALLLPTVNALSVLFWPLISPVILMSVYISYVNIFGMKTNGEETDEVENFRNVLRRKITSGN